MARGEGGGTTNQAAWKLTAIFKVCCQLSQGPAENESVANVDSKDKHVASMKTEISRTTLSYFKK